MWPRKGPDALEAIDPEMQDSLLLRLRGGQQAERAGVTDPVKMFGSGAGQRSFRTAYLLALGTANHTGNIMADHD